MSYSLLRPGTAGGRDDVSEASSMEIEHEEGEIVNTGNLIPKPPKFAGKRSELPYFLARLEKYFKYNLPEDATDTYKLDILSCYLEGSAAEWFADLEKEENPILNNYGNFITALQERYKTCTSADVANSRLTKLKASQFKSTSDYCERFEAIARDSSFNDEAKIYFFIEGLPVRIQERTKLLYPRIRKLPELINVVNANLEVDHRVYGRDPMDIDGRSLRPFNRGLGSSRYKSFYEQQDNHYEEPKKVLNTARPKKCFVCNKTGHLKKDCPRYKDKLANRPKAFTASSSSRNKMLNVFEVLLHHGSGLYSNALVDSGSDLEFMDWGFVNKYQIPFKRLGRDRYVEGLGGNGLLKFQTIPLIMSKDDHQESIQFYITTLPSKISIILGKEWLRKHDPCISFKNQTIEFKSEYCRKNCCATIEELKQQSQERVKEEEEEKRKRK